MSNRVTLTDLIGMTETEAAGVPVDQLAEMQTDLDAILANAARWKAAFAAVLQTKFGAGAGAARRQLGKDTGTVHLALGEFDVECELAKKVEWSEAGLRDVIGKLAEMGEPPEQYIEAKLSVQEKKYTAWPASLRVLFEPHRTVKPGTPKYTISRRQKEAA